MRMTTYENFCKTFQSRNYSLLRSKSSIFFFLVLLTSVLSKAGQTYFNYTKASKISNPRSHV